MIYYKARGIREEGMESKICGEGMGVTPADE
jgi:hypothetical protein